MKKNNILGKENDMAQESYSPRFVKWLMGINVILLIICLLLAGFIVHVGLLVAAEYYVCFWGYDRDYAFLENVRVNKSKTYRWVYENMPIENGEGVRRAAEKSFQETFGEEFVVTDLKWLLRQGAFGISWLEFNARDEVEGFASPKSNPDIRFRAWGSARNPEISWGDKSEYIRKSWQVQFKREMIQLLGTEDLRTQVDLDFAYEQAGISYDTTLSSLDAARKRYSPYLKYWVETYVYVPFDASRKVRKKVDSRGNEKYYPIVGDASTDALAEKLVQEMREKVFNALSHDAAEIVCFVDVLDEEYRNEARRIMREYEQTVLGNVTRFNDLSNYHSLPPKVDEWASERDALLSEGGWSWPPVQTDAAVSGDAAAK